jgi:hypothetical protein
MTVDVDKLAELARAATPGPWTYEDGCYEPPKADDEFPDSSGYDDMANVYGAPVEVGTPTRPVQEVPRLAYLPSNADAAFIAAANPAAVLELLERLRAAEAAVQLGASKLIHNQAFMAKLVDEHEKKYGDEKNVIMRAIVRELAAREPRGSEPHECGPCGASEREEHEPSCPYRRAVEATKS